MYAYVCTIINMYIIIYKLSKVNKCHHSEAQVLVADGSKKNKSEFIIDSAFEHI